MKSPARLIEGKIYNLNLAPQRGAPRPAAIRSLKNSPCVSEAFPAGCWAQISIPPLFFDACHVKFAPGNDFAWRLAGGTGPVFFPGSKLISAGPAAEAGGHSFENELGPFGRRVFANKIEIELYALIHDTRNFADDQIDAADVFGPRLFDMLHGDLQDVLSNA